MVETKEVLIHNAIIQLLVSKLDFIQLRALQLGGRMPNKDLEWMANQLFRTLQEMELI